MGTYHVENDISTTTKEEKAEEVDAECGCQKIKNKKTGRQIKSYSKL